jgi:hypothetical protein
MAAPKVCPFCRIEHQTSVPSIHTNGTSAESLLDGLSDALDHLRRGQRAMAAAEPNERDYYPHGPQAVTRAKGEAEERHIDLRRIITELEVQRDHIQAVIDFKAEQRRNR